MRAKCSRKLRVVLAVAHIMCGSLTARDCWIFSWNYSTSFHFDADTVGTASIEETLVLIREQRTRFPKPQLRAVSASSSVLDDDKPGSNDWTLWSPSTPALRCRLRAGRWCRSRTALWLKKVRVVRLGIHCDRFRPCKRVDGGNGRVLVG
jgi:hypothetical protein